MEIELKGITIPCGVFFILSVLLLYGSCTSGEATGYVKGVCETGLGIWDFVGLICCAPVYFIFIALNGAVFRWW